MEKSTIQQLKELPDFYYFRLLSNTIYHRNSLCSGVRRALFRTHGSLANDLYYIINNYERPSSGYPNKEL